MRLKSFLVIGPLLPAVGCNLFELGTHNLANESISRRDERRFDSRLESEARCVWQDVCRQFPARTFTPEFADGFTDGYADYLDVGGRPRPPAVPPLRYRRSSYLSPHGHALVRDYLVGFQYGVEVAVATGKREFLTVPVLLGESQSQSPLNVSRLPAPPGASLDSPPPGVPSPPAVDVPAAPGVNPQPAKPVPLPNVPAPLPPSGALPPLPPVPVPQLRATPPATPAKPPVAAPVAGRVSVQSAPPGLPAESTAGVRPPAEPSPPLPPAAEPDRP